MRVHASIMHKDLISRRYTSPKEDFLFSNETMSAPGARQTPHEPHFSTKGNIVFDAEVDSIGCCAATCLALACCSSHDSKRSYLILREDALEANFATKHPCCCCA